MAAAVCLYGYFGAYYGMSEAETSPTARVHADAPPFLVVHGDHDTLVPAADARRFVSALRQVSAAPVCHAELPGAQHSFDVLRSVRFDAVVDAVEVFAARVAETDGGGR
ncbi:MAG TPA: prolyl oligopeptidase family serine peptidase [Thermobifida alba]|nr:prolyl oligopeptidase family serine peptidase [Thermobifida alba]